MKKNNIRLSIGMPIFNGENFLAETLDSILGQSFSDFELIISDNGSTDRTQEICQSYMAKDRRIRYYRSEENLGAAKNYNRVFELASAEYFKWAPHDDLYTPDFLERCIDILDREPDVAVCYPRTTLIDERGEIQGYYADELHLRSPKPHQRFYEFFKKQGLCHPVFGVIRSSALKTTGLIGAYGASDRVLIGELALHGKFYELPDPLFLRRIHPQISTQANTNHVDLTRWFDPLKGDKLIFPRWRRFVEYFRAVNRAPLNQAERIRCYGIIAQFMLFPGRWLGMVRDVYQAVAFPLLSKNKTTKKVV